MRYQQLIWDWNGTLFDDAWLCVAIMNGMLVKRGLPMLHAVRYQQLFTFPVQEYYQRLGFDFSTDLFTTLAAEFMSAYDQRCIECTLQPGAHEALTILSHFGYQHCILSAYEQSRLVEMVRYTGLEEHFQHCTGLADYYAASKIDAGHALLKQLAHPGQSTVMIGDTLHDVDVARALSIDCVLVPSGHHAPQLLAGAGVPMFASLAELACYLQGEE